MLDTLKNILFEAFQQAQRDRVARRQRTGAGTLSLARRLRSGKYIPAGPRANTADMRRIRAQAA